MMEGESNAISVVVKLTLIEGAVPLEALAVVVAVRFLAFSLTPGGH